MNQQDAKRIIRQRFADYLAPAKKSGQFICPLCGHGKGGDGLAVVPARKGGDGCRLHCFGCGFHGDLIDLYAQEHALTWREAFRSLCREFGLALDPNEKPSPGPKPTGSPRIGRAVKVNRRSRAVEQGSVAANPARFRPQDEMPGAKGGFSSLCTGCAALQRTSGEAAGRLDGGGDGPLLRCSRKEEQGKLTPLAWGAGERRVPQGLDLPEARAYLQSRGISVETAHACGLMFDPAWVSPTALANLRDQGKDWSPPPSPRILIPTSEGGYTARATDPGTEPRFRKMKEGPAGLFNPGTLWNQAQRPVFVVEGEFDVLSIVEVGGLAVALGSVSNQGKLLDLISADSPSGTLILSLDNDEAGQNASLSLSEALQGLSVPFVVLDISCGLKDPSEALQAKRDAFVQAVRNAERRAGAQPDSVSFYLSRLMKGELARFREGSRRRTGFDCLDDEASGIYPGLYVLGAISSLGKTTLIHQIADQMAAMGEHVIYFSLEQSRLELVSKSLARNAAQRAGTGPFSSLDIRTGRVAGTALAALREAFKAYHSQVVDRFSIVESNFDCSAVLIRDYTARYMDRNSVKPVVVVDYLQILQPPSDFRGNDKQAMDFNITALKRLSRDLDLPVFAVSSVNRANYLAPIDFESFKESGGIEYTADVVWGLQLSVLDQELFAKEGHLKEKRDAIRKAKAANPRRVDLVCLKNRYGVSSYKVPFEYFPQWDWFREAGLPESGGAEDERF